MKPRRKRQIRSFELTPRNAVLLELAMKATGMSGTAILNGVLELAMKDWPGGEGER